MPQAAADTADRHRRHKETTADTAACSVKHGLAIAAEAIVTDAAVADAAPLPWSAPIRSLDDRRSILPRRGPSLTGSESDIAK